MIDDVRKFMVAAEQTTNNFNVRQTALYIGLQLEEMSEKLGALHFNEDLEYVREILDEASEDFKRGFYDSDVYVADREELLDADVDSIWVTIASVLSQGADAAGAFNEVARSNGTKIISGRLFKDSSGKVRKSENYSPPNLSPFVATSK